MSTNSVHIDGYTSGRVLGHTTPLRYWSVTTKGVGRLRVYSKSGRATPRGQPSTRKNVRETGDVCLTYKVDHELVFVSVDKAQPCLHNLTQPTQPDTTDTT